MKYQTALRSLLIATSFPLMLVGCQSTTKNNTLPEPHYTAMAKTVAKLREEPCNTPVTSNEQARLTQW